MTGANKICLQIDGTHHAVPAGVDPATKLSDYMRDYAGVTVRMVDCC